MTRKYTNRDTWINVPGTLAIELHYYAGRIYRVDNDQEIDSSLLAKLPYLRVMEAWTLTISFESTGESADATYMDPPEFSEIRTIVEADMDGLPLSDKAVALITELFRNDIDDAELDEDRKYSE
jgi:hypothetical protein